MPRWRGTIRYRIEYGLGTNLKSLDLLYRLAGRFLEGGGYRLLFLCRIAIFAPGYQMEMTNRGTEVTYPEDYTLVSRFIRFPP